jgi:hypothetical protein
MARLHERSSFSEERPKVHVRDRRHDLVTSAFVLPEVLGEGAPRLGWKPDTDRSSLRGGRGLGYPLAESVDRMKRLASRSTWWHMLPHKS